MKKYRFLAIALCIVMLFALAACSNGGNTQNPDSPSQGSDSPGSTPAAETPSTGDAPSGSKRDTLTVAVQQDTGTLDPVGISGAFLYVPTTYMEPLWDFKSGMETVWILATGIDEVTPTQWTVHLREGVTFSNGNPFTAEDVLFTLRLWGATPARALNVQSLDLEKSNVIDDHTIELILTEYNVAQMTMLSTLLVCDAESYEPEDFSLHPVGTGPYAVAEYVVNSHVNLKTRDDYWGEKPAIENLSFKVINEDSQRVNAIETGTVDMAAVPTQDIAYVEGLSGYKVQMTYSATCTMIMFNVNEASVFSDVEARYAVCYAVNRQAIADLVYNGYATVTDNPVSVAALDREPRFGNLHDTYSIGYNVELAKQYAESAGLVGKEIRIMTNGAADYVTMAEILQANLKEIGVNAVINNYDQATLRSLYRTDATAYDICLYSTAAPAMLASDMIYNNVRFSSILSAPGAWPGVERFMELGLDSLSNPDAKARSESLYEMYQLFTEAVPWYGVCDIATATAYSTDLSNVEFWALGNVRYQHLSFAS